MLPASIAAMTSALQLGGVVVSFQPLHKGEQKGGQEGVSRAQGVQRLDQVSRVGEQMLAIREDRPVFAAAGDDIPTAALVNPLAPALNLLHAGVAAGGDGEIDVRADRVKYFIRFQNGKVVCNIRFKGRSFGSSGLMWLLMLVQINEKPSRYSRSASSKWIGFSLATPPLLLPRNLRSPVHQGDHRVAVFTLLHTAVGGVDAQFPGGGLYKLCGLVAAKDAHVGGGSSQHGSVSGEVEGVSARIHCFGMHVFIDNIVAPPMTLIAI